MPRRIQCHVDDKTSDAPKNSVVGESSLGHFHHAPIVLDLVQLLGPSVPLPLGFVAGEVGPELLGPGVSFLAVLAYVGLLALVHHLQVAEEVVDPVDLQAAALLRALVPLDGHVVQLDVSDDEGALDVLLALGTPGVVAARLNAQAGDLE